jgi:hypothetical protein
VSPHRVGFVLCSPASNPIPSTRIAVLNMLPFLSAAGIETRILFEPTEPSETPDLSHVAQRAIEAGCDTIVLQKIRGPSAQTLARQLAEAGIKTVYCVCDLIHPPMVQATDTTVVVTEYLRSLYPAELQSRIHVVHDGIERPAIQKTAWNNTAGTRIKPLKAVLVTSASLDHLPAMGHPPPWLRLSIVGRYAHGIRRWHEVRWQLSRQTSRNQLDYLQFLANRRLECLPWDPEGVYIEMLQADIAVIPIDLTAMPAHPTMPPSWKVKSENRLTMKMSMGLPVIASPIPSYETVIEHGVNGFFARSRHDWDNCLTLLRDPERRQAMGASARDSVAKKYSMKSQAAKLIDILQGVRTVATQAP